MIKDGMSDDCAQLEKFTQTACELQADETDLGAHNFVVVPRVGEAISVYVERRLTTLAIEMVYHAARTIAGDGPKGDPAIAICAKRL